MTKETEQSRYLEYLPAIYHKDPSRTEGSFLGEFLLPFEEVLTGFEDLLSVIDGYSAPALTAPDFLPWLANWVALVLDENWEKAKQRRLISEAVELYRYRGMVAGLKRYLRIYNERVTPDVRERRWPGGMQIGVASQIGGITPDAVPLSRIESAERRHPPVYYDYYVVDTIAPASHPHAPEGQSLRLYYRADRVKSVKIGGEAGKRYVRIQLLSGETRRHEPATMVRRDGLMNDCYTLSVESETETETVRYRGDTFLIDEVELLYCFTVDLQVPCIDWEFLFSFQIASEDSTLPKAFRREFETHGISLSDDMTVKREEKGSRWWTIDDGGQRFILVRKGVVLNVYEWVGCRGWEEARQSDNVRTVRAIVDEVKPAHTMYYLKLTPVVSEYVLQPMQIGVHSTIDLDTTIG